MSDYLPIIAAQLNLSQEYAFSTTKTLGGFFSDLVPAAFSIAGIALLFYFIFAAVKLILSAGNKEAIASARNMITHSIIGFILLILLFLILQFVPDYFGFGGFRIIK